MKSLIDLCLAEDESIREDKIDETMLDTTNYIYGNNGMQFETFSMSSGENTSPAVKCGVHVIQDNFNEQYMDANFPARRTCIICNRHGDQVLVCSDNSCPLALHEKCMNIEPSYDEKEDFYCPYCWYKRAVDQTDKLRRKVSMVEKNLLDFMSLKVPDDNQQEQEAGETTNQATNNMGDKNCNADKSVVEATDVQNQNFQVDKGQLNVGVKATSVDGDQLKVVEQVIDSNDDNACKQEKAELVVDEPMDCMIGGNGDRENMSKTNLLQDLEGRGGVQEEESRQASNREHDIPVDKKHQIKVPNTYHAEEEEEEEEEILQESIKATKDGENQDTGDREKDGEQKVLKSARLTVERGNAQHSLEVDTGSDISDTETMTLASRVTLCRKTISNARAKNIDSLQKPSIQPKLTAQENASNQIRNSVGSKRMKSAVEENSMEHPESTAMNKKCRLVQQSDKQCSSPLISNQRRRKLLWTLEEENKLKEGVEKFQELNKNLPWRKILEFGRPVFHSTRTPAVLKDKWRKILAKELSKN